MKIKQNREIANRIKELREAVGLSKSELARQCDVTTTAVWNWEENGRIARSGTLELIAKALGVSKSFLLTGVDRAASAMLMTPARTVATIIEEARQEIAAITGVAIDKVRLNVEFVSS